MTIVNDGNSDCQTLQWQLLMMTMAIANDATVMVGTIKNDG